MRATIKGSVAGSIVCNLGTWGKNNEKSLSFTTEYQDVDLLISGVPTANDNHVVFKIGKYVGTVYLKKIEVYEALGANVINVGDEHFVTFSSENAFATAGYVNAYAAKYQDGHIALTPVTNVPANTGVIIEAAADTTYKVPVIESAASYIASVNDLQVSDGSVTGNGHHYALGKKGGIVGFAKVKSGVTIPEGKAYLYIETPPTSRDFIGFGDDATGIESVKQQAKADNQYFNIAGQRVAQPTKGLYIVNGKKVIIK